MLGIFNTPQKDATKTRNQLADCPLAESETISEAKVSFATHYCGCIRDNLHWNTIKLNLWISLGLGFVLLLIVLIVDHHFPFRSSPSSPHPVPSEQLWPQSPEHPVDGNAQTQPLWWVWNRKVAPPNQPVSVDSLHIQHVVPCQAILATRTKIQGPGPESQLFRVRMFFLLVMSYPS